MRKKDKGGGESHHLILDLTYSYNNQDWYWGEDGHTDQWNRAGSPDIHKYGQPIIYKFLKAIQLRKDCPFNKWDWNNWTSRQKSKPQSKPHIL